MNKAAIISSCERYRYTLERTWDPELPVLVFCMLNPSKADAVEDDPTIRRCIGFAKREGCGGIRVVNLFAWRTKSPSELPKCAVEAAGPSNDEWVQATVQGRRVVVAWGGSKPAAAAVTGPFLTRIRAIAVSVQCLGKTKAGAPRHPLYVRGDAPLVEF